MTAARTDVSTTAGIGVSTARAAERAVAPWPIVHAGATPADRARLEVVRTYPLPAGEVWSAVTEPERLGRWFADVTGDLRVDGTWTATFDQGAASGVVTECRPESRIVTSWRWHHDPKDAEPSRLTVRLEPVTLEPVTLEPVTLERVPDGTRLLLVHEGLTGNADGQAAGWYAFLAGLATHLAGTDPGEDSWDAEFARARAALRDPGAAGTGTF